MTDTQQYEETEAGRDIIIDSDRRDLYSELTQDSTSPFYEMDTTQVFMFALSYGWQMAGREPISDRQALFNRTSLDERQTWIIKSIAVKDQRTADVLKDEQFVIKIAQEYANGGINELHRQYANPEDTFTELSTDIIQRSNILDEGTQAEAE